MCIKERKQREKEQFRNRILETAIRIVHEDGFQALTIRKLAERIEYSPRTIYLYFSDKEELLKAIVEYGFAASVQNLEANDYYSGLSAEQHLRAAVSYHLKTAVENVNYYNAVIQIIQGKGFEPGPNQLKFEQYLSESLEPYLKMDGDSAFTMFLLFASIRGIAVELINKSLPVNADELNDKTELVFNFYKNLLET
ncbi:MAG: TetR/AcrR family transcriptional regulator [Spirochaetales bacterium]|uniref:TetR/AcrR family transcriptional regulator n=1 Tax=Candidatus Thalassospirochaeta sargassi TaxID=3119039 RepID=A0AAJ1ICT4_9SPIO|nr:TetR/AcrR family transcriptional regulator [Spirochaetales bacterium]